MPYLVRIDRDAEAEFNRLQDKLERNATFNVLDKLRQLGPLLIPPHTKSLKGEPGLLELRPRQGRSYVRAIYRRAESQFVVLAFAIKPDKADFGEAVMRARERFARYDDLDDR
jgi:phage-related protein